MILKGFGLNFQKQYKAIFPDYGMKIPITFLGTGQAIPTIKRSHTSILLSYQGENIMVDCGEGTQRQLRKAQLNPCSITRILITHWHGDHILGLPGLLQTLALNGYNKTLHIYGPKGTSRYFSAIMEMFVFAGKIKVEIKEIAEGKVFETQDFYIDSKPMQHGTPSLAYSFIEKEKIKIDKDKMKKLKLEASPLMKELKQGKTIEIKGKKISPKDLIYKEEGKKITFILDTKLNENCSKLAENSDLLICESTYTQSEEEQASEYLHLTAEQAAGIAKKSKSKRLILVHLSQRYEHKEKLVLSEAKKVFKNTEIGQDLMKIEV
jgi:ribonuclease Z